MKNKQRKHLIFAEREKYVCLAIKKGTIARTMIGPMPLIRKNAEKWNENKQVGSIKPPQWQELVYSGLGQHDLKHN